MDDKANEKLQSHFTAYTKNLPRKMAEIEFLWDYMLKQWTHENLVELHIKTHSLRGSAGIFGHEEVGIAAGNLDTMLKNFLDDSVPTNEQKDQINRLLMELKNTITLTQPTVGNTE